jgi:Endoplasmic reticulum-based factor for assembly of V-ATPase
MMSSSSSNQDSNLLKGYTLTSTSHPPPSTLKTNYTPVVPTERSRGPLALTATQEAEEWAQIRRVLSAILNVLVSMGGVATALYWAASSSSSLSVPFRTLLALAGALLVGGAEAFLYVRSFSAAEESERRKREKLKGFALGEKSKLVDDDTLKRLQEEQMKRWKEEDAAQQERVEAPVAPAGELKDAASQIKARQRKNKGKPK